MLMIKQGLGNKMGHKFGTNPTQCEKSIHENIKNKRGVYPCMIIEIAVFHQKYIPLGLPTTKAWRQTSLFIVFSSNMQDVVIASTLHILSHNATCCPVLLTSNIIKHVQNTYMTTKPMPDLGTCKLEAENRVPSCPSPRDKNLTR